MNREPAKLLRVVILLPSYNGEAYLEAQLASLWAQDHGDFLIVARDDGSSDGSDVILQKHAQVHPDRLRVLPADGHNRGACGSFSLLLDYVLEHQQALGLTPLYVLFCDQDDLWHPSKIRVTLEAMLALEARHPQRACLVHSDLRVVDEQGSCLAESFYAFQDIRPGQHRFSRELVSNSVTGCTAMLNEKLARLASPIPAGAMMHDWWVALVAAAFGHIVPLDDVLVDYRQHGKNTLGAREYRASRGGMSSLRRLNDPDMDALTRGLYCQAAAFAGRHSQNLRTRDVFALSMVLWLGARWRWWRNLVFKAMHTLFR